MQSHENITIQENHYPTEQPIIYYRLKKLSSAFIHGIFTQPAAFFGLSPILNNVPHVHANNPLGFLKFNLTTAKKLTEAALKSGITTFWIGPIPVIYVTSNAIRHVLIQESHVGSVDVESAKYLSDFLMGGNTIMKNFPAFMNFHSITYQKQRKFLYSEFHAHATKKLDEIEEASVSFLKHHTKSTSSNVYGIRDFVTTMILHTSSHLLSLNECPLDILYLENKEYKKAIEKVAYYGVSGQANSELEETLYQLFLDILKRNFNNILHGENLIRNIFDSMSIAFPEKYEDFFLQPEKICRNIAMSFCATALGGLVHSTTNTLDWAIASLLKDPSKANEFAELMKKHKDINLSDKNIFDKEGELYPIAEYVMHNVFLYPPFSHELFVNSKPFTETLPDGSIINVPKMSITVVNYEECNKSDKLSENFSEHLTKQSTAGQLITKKEIASFGGSRINKNNHYSRVCPAAKLSLYEQMIIIAILFRDYSLETTHAADISLEIDAKQFPIYSRVNNGNIILKAKHEPLLALTQSSPQISKQLTLVPTQIVKDDDKKNNPETSMYSRLFHRVPHHHLIKDFKDVINKMLPAMKFINR